MPCALCTSSALALLVEHDGHTARRKSLQESLVVLLDAFGQTLDSQAKPGNFR